MLKLTLHTDGGARGNPGLAGAGVVILNENGEVLREASKFLGDNLTNNEAEYQALIFGLAEVKSYLEREKLVITEADLSVKMDSELVVKQLRGEYKVKEARLKELVKKVREISENFSNLNFQHIPREENKLADKLANEAMDTYAAADSILP